MAIETDFAAETTTDPHYADERTALELETDRTWPFYFGHLLIDWLLAAQGRPGLATPFDPALP
jgi:hypothetical protein